MWILGIFENSNAYCPRPDLVTFENGSKEKAYVPVPTPPFRDPTNDYVVQWKIF
jgi:hypothetical protein